MVLAVLGCDTSEAELRRLCDCTWRGTDALKAVDAARKLGFAGTRKYKLTLTELEGLVREEHFPIVFVDLNPLRNIGSYHSLVVLEVQQLEIRVYDPEEGERTIALEMFNAAWDIARNLTIIVEP